MLNIGLPGLILILLTILLLFGPKRLPELGKATGETLRSFRDAVSGQTKRKNEKDPD
ncbi:twin-arginine translocase TatA/TatE family subunit [Staphylospora marina]|uniref:twin-arginine translocase TatA/TatE family subunit n=1 Tax=Staphylospora marina TaxID=2490858 RepID=UPI000F5BE7FF|nr:twin-arginine translocase TatA/TatE family subunit [Staphylospora marina]